jgi:hypothetical protein
MDLLDRLHDRLRAAVRKETGPAADRTLTIAEIYQQLIPYRALRGEMGIHELAQYEHALLRMLAGEGDYLRLEMPEVQEEFRRELAAPSPILGIYRDYAAVGVVLRPRPAPPAAAPAAAPAPAPATPAAAPPARCRQCAVALPAVPDLRFCPACGAEQEPAPCGACGAPMRAGWKFCVRCGTPRATGARGR